MMLRAGRRDSRLPPKESGTVRASIYGHLPVTSIRYTVGSNFSKIWSQQTSKHLLAFTICGFICVSKGSRWITVVPGQFDSTASRSSEAPSGKVRAKTRAPSGSCSCVFPTSLHFRPAPSSTTTFSRSTTIFYGNPLSPTLLSSLTLPLQASRHIHRQHHCNHG